MAEAAGLSCAPPVADMVPEAGGGVVPVAGGVVPVIGGVVPVTGGVVPEAPVAGTRSAGWARPVGVLPEGDMGAAARPWTAGTAGPLPGRPELAAAEVSSRAPVDIARPPGVTLALISLAAVSICAAAGARDSPEVSAPVAVLGASCSPWPSAGADVSGAWPIVLGLVNSRTASLCLSTSSSRLII